MAPNVGVDGVGEDDGSGVGRGAQRRSVVFLKDVLCGVVNMLLFGYGGAKVVEMRNGVFEG